MINVVLLLIGIFLDPPPAILLLTPILMPIVKDAGIDPVHFGVVMTANLSIGCFTPPFGVNIFVAQAVFKEPVGSHLSGRHAVHLAQHRGADADHLRSRSCRSGC